MSSKTLPNWPRMAAMVKFAIILVLVALQAPGQDGGAVAPQTPDAPMAVARRFFRSLLAGDARGAVQSSAVPFLMEQRTITSSEALFDEWLKSLSGKRPELLTLYGIELLTPAQMEKRFGKPPVRLSAFESQSKSCLFAVANLSGHAAVALLKQTDMGLRVVGYTD